MQMAVKFLNGNGAILSAFSPPIEHWISNTSTYGPRA